MTTRAELEPQIATVRRALNTYRRAVDTVSSDDLRTQYVGAYNTNLRAVDSWATKQADEVVAGTRPLAKWREYGTFLEQQLGEHVGQIGFTERWSEFADTGGNIAQAALKPIDDQVAKLRVQLDQVTAKRNAWIKERETLTPISGRLSADVREVYWGPPAQRAEQSYGRFKFLVESLESGVRALHGGDAIDFSALAQSNGMQGGLGNPFVGVAGALAVIAIAGTFAVSLNAFFDHATEVTRAETAQAVVELTKTDPASAIALQKALNDAEGLRNPPTVSAGAVVAGVVIVGTLVAIGVWLHKRSKRVTNPRRRRRKSSRARKEAHA